MKFENAQYNPRIIELVIMFCLLKEERVVSVWFANISSIWLIEILLKFSKMRILLIL